LAVVKSRPQALWKVLHSFPTGRKAYYSIRGQKPHGFGITKRAARFIYLNRFCFNGLYRTNLRGEFNVPYSPTKTGDLPTLDELLIFSRKLRTAELLAGDFEATLANVQKNDFVYLDPPYVVAGRRVFSEYGADCFSEADLARLRDELIRINSLGAKFVVSYARCSEAEQYFKTWPIKTVRIRRNIAGFAGARKKAYELLISNITSIDAW
jgi:DNA adenine methylase